MLLQIMVQRGQLFAGGMVAAGAGFVSIPADFRTGRGFCTEMHQIMVIWVFFAVFRITHLTDRFGGAGCCATGTVCGLIAVAAIASVAVHIHVANGRPRAPVVTENAVFRAAFFTDFSCDAGERSGAAAAAFGLFCVAALASAGVRAVAGVVRRPCAPVVTENAVFRAA